MSSDDESSIENFTDADAIMAEEPQIDLWSSAKKRGHASTVSTLGGPGAVGVTAPATTGPSKKRNRLSKGKQPASPSIPSTKPTAGLGKTFEGIPTKLVSQNRRLASGSGIY